MENVLVKTTKILHRTPKVLQAMLEEVCEELLHTPESEHTWSVWQVTAHLLYMEQNNWPQRVKLILSEGRTKTFEAFDREKQFKVVEGKSIDFILNEFTRQREVNMLIIKQLHIYEEKLNCFSGLHPEFGEVNLPELLTTWAAHDLTHIQQIARIMSKVYNNKVILALMD